MYKCRYLAVAAFISFPSDKDSVGICRGVLQLTVNVENNISRKRLNKDLIRLLCEVESFVRIAPNAMYLRPGECFYSPGGYVEGRHR